MKLETVQELQELARRNPWYLIGKVCNLVEGGVDDAQLRGLLLLVEARLDELRRENDG